MSQKAKLKNMKISSYDPVKGVIDSILLGVSKAITIRIAAKRTIQKAIEDAILSSEESKELKERCKIEKEIITRQLRRDSRTLKYRIDPSLSITNPISGIVYEVLLRQVDRQKNWKNRIRCGVNQLRHDQTRICSITVTYARHKKEHIHTNLVQKPSWWMRGSFRW